MSRLFYCFSAISLDPARNSHTHVSYVSNKHLGIRSYKRNCISLNEHQGEKEMTKIELLELEAHRSGIIRM